MSKRLGILGAIALAFIGIAAVGGTATARASCSLTSSPNPSAVGQTVSFDQDCIGNGGGNVEYVVGIVNTATGETVQMTVTGDFTYTFDEAGEYFVNLFSQRNGKSVRDLASTTQTVI